MTPDERERMNLLCARIQDEKNYDNFVGLLRDLGGLIERKERRLGHYQDQRLWLRTRPWKTLRGIVTKIVRPIHPEEPEKVEIAIEAAEDLFREIRIENTLTNVDGSPVALKNGAEVDVTFEAEATDIVRRKVDLA
jgi:hypothetical protein